MIAYHLGELLSLRYFESDEIDDLLRGETVPDTYILMVSSGIKKFILPHDIVD